MSMLITDELIGAVGMLTAELASDVLLAIITMTLVSSSHMLPGQRSHLGRLR